MFHIRYWDSLIYLKGIHQPNVLSPIIFKKSIFGIFRRVPLWRDQNPQFLFWKFSASCFLVYVCCTYLCCILHYIHILCTICYILQFVWIYMWLLLFGMFYGREKLFVLPLIDWNVYWAQPCKNIYIVILFPSIGYKPL